jgi:hypothetical protein
VALFGFHSQIATYSSNKDGSRHLELQSVPQAATGEVIEVHPIRRDSSQYPFPCFRINARIDGAMSGGPVFNETGELVGLNCGTLAGDLDAEQVSYATTLWPLLRILVTFNPSGGDAPIQQYPLVDLAVSGRIAVADLGDLDPKWFPGRALRRTPT